MQPYIDKWKEEASFQWIIISGDDPDDLKDFLKENGITATVLLDTKWKVFQQYQVRYTPTQDLINTDGIIFKRQVGWDKNKAPGEILTWLLDS